MTSSEDNHTEHRTNKSIFMVFKEDNKLVINTLYVCIADDSEIAIDRLLSS